MPAIVSQPIKRSLLYPPLIITVLWQHKEAFHFHPYQPHLFISQGLKVIVEATTTIGQGNSLREGLFDRVLRAAENVQVQDWSLTSLKCPVAQVLVIDFNNSHALIIHDSFQGLPSNDT